MSDHCPALLDALADSVEATLGRGGTFAKLGKRRTEEILLLLLHSGRTVRAHSRVWEIEIPSEDIPAVRAAGGYLTLDEYRASRQPLL